MNPALPPAGLDALHCDQVREAWIDSNNHMNLAYYVVVFDHATDALFKVLDVSSAYRARSQCSMFVVETHTLYRREMRLGAPIRTAARLIGADAKRLHLFHSMFHATDHYLAATQELMCLHIDMASRRAVPFPADVQTRLAALLQADPRPIPEAAGRAIAMPARPSARADQPR
ncbi:MAG: thioesterase family protein [Rhodospirillales bacterium]|nr:thioesterase family protein [Rhodospirillales bacterium]